MKSWVRLLLLDLRSPNSKLATVLVLVHVLIHVEIALDAIMMTNYIVKKESILILALIHSMTAISPREVIPRIQLLFVFAIPDALESEVVAPIFCAGLTLFSPLVRNLGEDARGKTVGIIGIGGLGHLAIQFGAALGAEVYALSRSSRKLHEAKKMGASDLIATGEDKDWAKKYQDKFDLIVNCASTLVDLNVNDYLSVLKVRGTLLTVGVGRATETLNVQPFSLIFGGSKVAGSAIGSKKEVNLMLKIAAEKGVKTWIETIQLGEEGCNTALSRCDKGDIRYRFVYTGFDTAFGNK